MKTAKLIEIFDKELCCGSCGNTIFQYCPATPEEKEGYECANCGRDFLTMNDISTVNIEEI
jgi:hypothetical protein